MNIRTAVLSWTQCNPKMGSGERGCLCFSVAASGISRACSTCPRRAERSRLSSTPKMFSSLLFPGLGRLAAANPQVDDTSGAASLMALHEAEVVNRSPVLRPSTAADNKQSLAASDSVGISNGSRGTLLNIVIVF